MIHDPVDEDADSNECEQEGDRGKEHAPPRTVGNGGADQESEPRQLQQDQQDNNDQAGEGQQKQRSGTGHTLLKHFTLIVTRKTDFGFIWGSVSAVTIYQYSDSVK
jgi:hypothetical protein